MAVYGPPLLGQIEAMAVWTAQSDDDPLFRVQGYGVYVTEFLIATYIVFFVLEALSQALGIQGWLGQLTLSTGGVIGQGRVWQLLTYPLLNPLSIWFAIEMLMLYWFGREVERTLGRKGFIALYAALIVIPAILLTGLGLATHQSFVYQGSSSLHFTLFVAFAVLFPEAPIFFGLLAKWVAIVLVALNSLLCVAYHQWAELAILWAGIGVAVTAIRIPFVANFVTWIEERQERERQLRLQAQIAERKRIEERRNQSIDPILDKIAKQGIQSLTRDEREQLEQARLELLKRDQRK